MSDNTYDVTFVDEPPADQRGQNSRYADFYQALRDNPGKWAKYPGAASAAHGYAKKNEGFEAVARGSNPPVGWMRYVGEEAV